LYGYSDKREDGQRKRQLNNQLTEIPLLEEQIAKLMVNDEERLKEKTK